MELFGNININSGKNMSIAINSKATKPSIIRIIMILSPPNDRLYPDQLDEAVHLLATS
jgi:hypothetical protein